MNHQAYKSIPDAFTAVVASSPSHTAIFAGERRISYQELDDWSDLIAAELRARGVGRGALVGLFMPRSAAAIAAILGTLKTGAAYLPFDTSYPAALLKHLYEDSKPGLMLLAQAGDATAARQPFWRCQTMAIEPATTRRAHLNPVEAQAPGSRDDRAYVMYTSGSTGRPKGVCIPQRGVLRLVINNPFVSLDSEQVLLQLSPLSFDASTFEIWGALLNGGTLAIPPAPPLGRPYSLEDIATAVQHYGVTTLWLTAGVFHLMIDHQLAALRGLQQLLAGGDILSPTHVARALRGLPKTQIINGYGPTENTTFSCCYRIPADHPASSPVPIGTAIAGTRLHVFDGGGRPTPQGQEGELYVGGAGVALGYLNRPDLTAERFIEDPFDARTGALLYRTGDRVRIGADGNLQFLGRVDRQVKINGKRVELDEIEACLRRSPGVRDAAVICFESGGQKRLAAFVAPTADMDSPYSCIGDHLRRELPDYMQPSMLSLLDALPLSPSGKIDRARLPLPPTDLPPQTNIPVRAIADPRTRLRQIWREVLSISNIADDDNFFDLGGTSLQLLQVHATIQSALKPGAQLLDLYTHTTIDTLTLWIEPRAPGPYAGSAISAAQERGLRQRSALTRSRPPEAPSLVTVSERTAQHVALAATGNGSARG